jgi:DNA invertase Pin-like site-specific DNA recombinase
VRHPNILGEISTRATTRPELDKAINLARELRASGVAVTLVVHEHKRLGRSLELAALAEQLNASDVGLEFLSGELRGSHDPSGVVFTVLAALSGTEREYIRDRTLEGHESARSRGKSIGGASVTDDHMLSMALHLRGQELSLRDIAARLCDQQREEEGATSTSRGGLAPATRARRRNRRGVGERLIGHPPE